MKKIVLLIAVMLAMCSLSGCRIEGYNHGYDDGYDDGYESGYDIGYEEGVTRAQRYISFVLDDDLDSLAYDIEDTYGIHPEEAVQILSNYADVPDEVTEEELLNAIWAIYRYYHDSIEVVNGIEDYLID